MNLNKAIVPNNVVSDADPISGHIISVIPIFMLSTHIKSAVQILVKDSTPYTTISYLFK